MRQPRDGRDGAQGLPGLQGKQGPAGRDGVDGSSIYAIAVAKGFKGDEEAFLASLKGARGEDGPEGKIGPEGKHGPSGKDGAPGRNGIDGASGRTGKDGVAGPRGPIGPEGPMGPMPRHYWEGTTLYFEQPIGGWDAGVDLKGPAGKAGRDGFGGGGSSDSGGGSWGSITGTLSAQTDLQSALNAKLGDAPIDGTPYWRKDGSWQIAVTGGGATWGAVIGTLSDQTDLQNALDDKANTADLSAVATSGDYGDLSNKPTLGTAAAHATGDFATAAQGTKADSALQSADISGFSIAWSQLTSTPTTLSGYGISDAESSSHAAATYATITNLALKAPLASPALTGTPTVPTASPGTNSTQAASTAYADAIAALKSNIASPTFTGTPAAPTASPGTNSTQLATTAYADAIAALKANLASPTFTGTPAAPTAAGGTNTTQVATTAYVQSELSAKAPLASPTFTGTPAAPTAGAGTNTTQLATTAFVAAAVTAKTESIGVACSDETTALTTGTSKVTFRMPYAFTLTGVRASLSTAQTSGSIFTVDINESGTTILSTKLTIDNTEKTSTTAAAAPVISDASLANDAEITVDIDQIGDGTAKGLKIYLIGHQ